MVVEFKARRDLVVDGLNRIPGIKAKTPLGAFYAFPDVSGTGLSGAQLDSVVAKLAAALG